MHSINLHIDRLLPSLFETTIDAFKSGAKEIGNSILMSVIFYLKETEIDYIKILDELEENPSLSLELDTEEFHDIVIKMEDMTEKALKKAKVHKDESEILNQYYKTIESLYSNILSAGMEVSEIASQLRHEAKLAS